MRNSPAEYGTTRDFLSAVAAGESVPSARDSVSVDTAGDSVPPARAEFSLSAAGARRGAAVSPAAVLAGWPHGTSAWNRRVLPAGRRPGGPGRLVPRLPGPGRRRERPVA